MPASKYVSGKEVCRTLRISKLTLQKWAKDGCPNVSRDGCLEYEIAAVFHWAVNAAKTKALGGQDPVQARARKDAAQADLTELKRKQLSGDLVTTREAFATYVQAFERARTHLMAIPNKAAPLLDGCATGPERAALIERLIREAIDEARAKASERATTT